MLICMSIVPSGVVRNAMRFRAPYRSSFPRRPSHGGLTSPKPVVP